MSAIVVGPSGKPLEIPDWLIAGWERATTSPTVSVFVLAGEDQSGFTAFLTDIEDADPSFVLDDTAWHCIRWLTLFFIEREWIQGSDGKPMRVRSDG